MSFVKRSLAAAAFCLFVFAVTGRADEKKIPLDQVPKAIMEAAKAKFAGAEFKGAEIEKEDGKTLYELAFKYQGANYEAEFTPEGKLVGYDKVISANDLPKAVADALQAKYPGATYKEVEEVHKVDGDQDKLEGYEVQVVHGKKRYEVVVSPEGKITKEEDKSKAKEE
jgi:uncharacterized membrane protein YkoI